MANIGLASWLSPEQDYFWVYPSGRTNWGENLSPIYTYCLRIHHYWHNVKLSRWRARRQCVWMDPKGSSTPSDYATVTVTLTGGAFDLLQIFKGAARQRYGDRSVIARCEQTLKVCLHVPLCPRLQQIYIDGLNRFRTQSVRQAVRRHWHNDGLWWTRARRCNTVVYVIYPLLRVTIVLYLENVKHWRLTYYCNTERIYLQKQISVIRAW